MKQLITTPIYYVNDVPHIGHAYTTIIADMLKKHKWLRGDEVFLLTGTDEHGQKIEQAAKAKDKPPKAYTDEVSAVFRSLWDMMGIDYDHFIRTTDESHKQTIVQVFERLCANGDVYLGEYEGDYCVSCESFFLNVDSGICPDCAGSKPLSKIKEESYFFALSKYEKRLLEWYASSEDVILPKYRKNEVVRFVESGLQDLSISRTSFEWGVALPKHKGAQKQHIAYVWLDALFNYMSAFGLYQQDSSGGDSALGNHSADLANFEATADPKSSSAPKFAKNCESTTTNPRILQEASGTLSSLRVSEAIYLAESQAHRAESRKSAAKPTPTLEYWECATHIVGKDILRFHAVYWPAFLMSLGLPLPKHIYAHGWWMRDGQKMSKSLGNVVDPRAFTKAYGAEVLRYYLLRETPFGQDGDFSQKLLCERINSELANDLGNLLHRFLAMCAKYAPQRGINSFTLENQGVAEFVVEHYGDEVKTQCKILDEINSGLIESMQIKAYIEAIWKLLHLGNAMIAKYEPWNLFKNGKSVELNAILNFVGYTLLKVANALYPIMPQTASTIAMAFGQGITPASYIYHIKQNKMFHLPLEVRVIPPLFQKLDSMLIPEAPLESTFEKVDSSDCGKEAGLALVSIEDFSKLDIRVGEVLEAEPVPKSSKLLRLKIDLGESEPRVVLSGIAQYYTPKQLISTQVCVIANLKPAKIMGQFSYGMILASKDDESLSLVRIDGKRKNGSRIS